MATSADHNMASVVTASACWRVKYRLVTKDNVIIRKKIRIEYLGVHPKNRGGVYPAGVRVKSLAVEVLDSGFVKEEVNHAVVVVEEPPAEEIRSRGKKHMTASRYNSTECEKDEYLITCFRVPYDDVRHVLLGHNHIMLVMRSFLTGAKWDLPSIEEKGIYFCDKDGRLSLSAVAAHPNGKEMQELIEEGMTCEILSWKMDVEEPTAASTISHALNKGHELALRTTELTAIKVLKGEIMIQMSLHVGERVAFQTVRDRVRAQISDAADDPDLPGMFDFLITSGVGVNSYIDDLLEFGARFVDSKKRQLRFAAFAAANKVCEQAPWTRIGIIKRAYRKKPTYGFCPSPESQWGKFAWADVERLEELLRFFHVTSRPSLDRLDPQSRNKLLANIDVAATEAFWVGKDEKAKHSMETVQRMMLEATVKFVAPHGPIANERVPWSWIDFRNVAAEETSHAESVSADAVAPAVLQFDEASGSQLNQQVDFDVHIPENEPIQLPWQVWRSHTDTLGADAADQASAVAVLHNLHEGYNYAKQKIDLWQHERSTYVVATGACEAKAILLPPCVPKQSKVVKRCQHPLAVHVVVKVMKSPESGSESGSGSVLRQTEYSVMPELLCPEKAKQNAVAGSQTAVAANQTAVAAPEWVWRGQETMHPFWAVRRMTQKQLLLAQDAFATKKSGAHIEWRPRFNCSLEKQSLSCVCIAIVGGQAVNRTRIIDVPCLTNFVPLELGEELIMEITTVEKKKTEEKRTWQTAMKNQEKATARQTAKAAKKAAKAN